MYVHTKALRPPLEATTGQTMHPSVQELHARAMGKGHRRARLLKNFAAGARPSTNAAAGAASAKMRAVLNMLGEGLDRGGGAKARAPQVNGGGLRIS